MTDQPTPAQKLAAVQHALGTLREDTAQHPPRQDDFFTGVQRVIHMVGNLWQLSRITVAGDPSGELHSEDQQQQAAARFTDDLLPFLATAEQDARPQPGDTPDEAPPGPVGDGILYGISVIRRALHITDATHPA